MNSKGHFRCYEERNFQKETLETIRAVNHIVEQYEAKGLMLTLRQIYYQFVARGWMPNKQSEYNRLGRIVSDGRMAGLISWTAIEDRGRTLRGINTFESPQHAIRNALNSYHTDMWANQHWKPEVWVEKAALEGVIGSICNHLRVDFFAQKGYNSMSAQWEAAQRFSSYIAKGQRPIIFHLGDHDPSGLDMTNDNRSRLETFCGVPVIVQRLALNMSQIEQYNPPPNPAKDTDSRFEAYAAKYGDESWELDALDPEVIQRLIRDSVLRVRDEALWQEALQEETDDRRVLESMMEGLTET